MEEQYYHWLNLVPGIGRRTMARLLEKVTPRQLYEEGIGKELPLKENQRAALEEARLKRDPWKEWDRLQAAGIWFLCPVSQDYPTKLKQIPDPPLTLYGKGDRSCLYQPSVAVIGARDCSPYGSVAAKEIGRALACEGISVVSGMARGVDGISQWAALEQGGRSIAVLGNGVEICYPKENRRLYERLIREGCVLSESLPTTEPKAGLFPLRNRLISGLSEAVLVIEAKERSGTLITVDMALEQGKEVYAMPGRITDRLSLGCNRLIRQGAGLCLSPREFAREMAEVLSVNTRSDRQREGGSLRLTEEERQLYLLLEALPMSVDSIWQRGRQHNPTLTLAQVMEGLLTLVGKGAAQTHEQYFFRSEVENIGNL